MRINVEKKPFVKLIHSWLKFFQLMPITAELRSMTHRAAGTLPRWRHEPWVKIRTLMGKGIVLEITSSLKEAVCFSHHPRSKNDACYYFIINIRCFSFLYQHTFNHFNFLFQLDDAIIHTAILWLRQLNCQSVQKKPKCLVVQLLQ